MKQRDFTAPSRGHVTLKRRGFRMISFETIASRMANLAISSRNRGLLQDDNSLITEFQVANGHMASIKPALQTVALLIKTVTLPSEGRVYVLQGRLSIGDDKPLTLCEQKEDNLPLRHRLSRILRMRDFQANRAPIRSDGALAFPPCYGTELSCERRLNDLRFYLTKQRNLRDFKP